MKKLIAIFVLSLMSPAFNAFSFTLSVGNPVYDAFNYTPAGASTDYLSGQTNPQGLTWVDAGAVANVHKPYIQSANLSYPGLAADVGNEVIFGGSVAAAGISAKLPIGATITSGTVYYSMILVVSAVPAGLSTTSGANGITVAGFNNTTASSTAQPSVVGAPLYMRSLSSGTFQIGVAEAISSPVAVSYGASPVTYTPGANTFFIVGSYTFSAAGSTADTASLWINPSSSTFGAVNPASIPTPTIGPYNNGNALSRSSGIQSFHLRDAVPYAPTIVGDALRVGLTWADVTPPAAETPSFSGLVASPSTTYGGIVTLSGTVSATSPNTLYPNPGETITVTINGHAETTTINDDTGDFSISYNTGDHLPVSGSPYTITYSYAGNGYLNTVSDTSTTMTVSKANQTITWVVNPLPDQTYGAGPIALLGDATSSSGAAVSYSIVSGPASIAGTTLTITGVGTVTVDANQTGAANYNDATPVPESFNVVNSYPVLPIASQTFAVANGLQVCWPTISGVVYNVLTNGNLANANVPAAWVEDTAVSPVTGDGNTDCVTIPTASLPSTNIFVLIKQNSN